MRKIPTLFLRGENRRYVTRDINPVCTWVVEEPLVGVATRKYDGTAVMLDEEGSWWARRTVKRHGYAPRVFLSVEQDDVTGDTVGWVPISMSGWAPWLDQALFTAAKFVPRPGTYELCGEKVNGNPEHITGHVLVPHGYDQVFVRRDYDSVMVWCRENPTVEGIVWWEKAFDPSGRMAKIKARDFPTES